MITDLHIFLLQQRNKTQRICLLSAEKSYHETSWPKPWDIALHYLVTLTFCRWLGNGSGKQEMPIKWPGKMIISPLHFETSRDLAGRRLILIVQRPGFYIAIYDSEYKVENAFNDSKDQKQGKLGQKLFWLLWPWPLTSDLELCMDITSVHGNFF